SASDSISVFIGGSAKLKAKFKPLTAPTINLTGDSSKFSMQVDTANLSVNTGGKVKITNLNTNIAFPSLTLADSSGQTFTLTSPGPITLNDISTSNGSIKVVSQSGLLQTVAGAQIAAVSAGKTATITLEGSSLASSSILIGSGSNIATSGPKGGDVKIFLGSNAPQLNPLPAGTSGQITVVLISGQVFSGETGIIANSPVNTLTAKNANVIFNDPSGAAGNITLDGSVTITADPPTAGTSGLASARA